MGPLMLDCLGCELNQVEQEILAHPTVGGVILFTRNYYDHAQIKHLISSIRAAAKRPILIAIDHEGGRVQRFRDGFTRIPAMGQLQVLASEPLKQEQLATAAAIILAYELRVIGVDMTFAPVLDINGCSDVIGDRAFAEDAEQIIPLASAFIQGLATLDMPAVGKHFPGHGSVKADSHVALPVDSRSLETISANDMQVFAQLIQAQKLAAVMPSHVVYESVDSYPAGFSQVWLQQILRDQLGFTGAIFSDDLSMHGASVAGSYADRAERALAAGCDMILACNNPTGAIQIIDALPVAELDNVNLSNLVTRHKMCMPYPLNQAERHYQQAIARLNSYACET